ncbi:MAG TPA: hypothetical protein VF985_03200 [Mariniflexile sp.]
MATRSDKQVKLQPKHRALAWGNQKINAPVFFCHTFCVVFCQRSTAHYFFNWNYQFFKWSIEKNKELSQRQKNKTKSRCTPTTTTVPLMPEKNGVSYLT